MGDSLLRNLGVGPRLLPFLAGLPPDSLHYSTVKYLEIPEKLPGNKLDLIGRAAELRVLYLVLS